MKRVVDMRSGQISAVRSLNRPGLVVLAAASTLLACEVSRTASGEEEVRSVVQAYFAGLMEGSPESLDRAFHPATRLIGIGGRGTLAMIPYGEWKEVVTEDGPRGPEGFSNEILSVDIHGVAATVKTKRTWPDVVYVEYLSLVHADGEWKIVNKIWNAEPTARRDTLSG